MTDFEELVERYRGRGLLIDSNLLLLLLVGGVDPSLVGRFKRTKQFTREDFFLLRDIVVPFTRIVTTPHILTEVSNLAGHLKGQDRDAFFQHLGESIQVLDEQHIPARQVALDDWLVRLGITDTAVTLLINRDLLALTVDAQLASCIAGRNGDVINFNHLRSAI